MPIDNVVTPGDQDMLLAPGQDLVLQDREGHTRLRLDAATGTISVRTADGKLMVLLEAGRANLWFGGAEQDGDLLLFPSTANSFDTEKATIHLSAGEASLRLGDEALPGRLSARGAGHRVELDGGAGRLRASEQVEVRTPQGQLRARLNSDGSVIVGGDGTHGQLHLRNSGDGVRIAFNAATANGSFGGEGEAGALFVRDASGADVIVLNGATSNLGLGREGSGASILIKDDSGEDTIVLRGTTGNIGVGRSGRAGNVFVKNSEGQNTIHLDGQSGDILLSNADCAEDFDIAGDVQDFEPGTVLVIDEREQLRPTATAYDRRVAGVVSGAGRCRPGLILDRRPSIRCRVPVALIGKVYCKVDACYAPIHAGDLLTTSSTPGHAMKATDPSRTPGAVLGKALKSFMSGQGLIPVIVALH